MIEFELPFPKRELSPNARLSWQAKSVHIKEARLLGKSLTLYKFNGAPYREKRLALFLKFYPPDRRKRDLDNLFASCKPYLDGICEGLHLDDSQFREVTLYWGKVEKPGKVKVRIGLL